ncbi:MAG: glucose-6-phosphate isomerase [Pseudobdellovibrionaceae bacterium]
MKIHLKSEVPVLNEKAWSQFFTRDEIGFKELPKRTELWQKSEKLAKELRAKYSDLVVIGIGGSSLGVQVLSEVLPSTEDKQIHAWDFVDPYEFERKLKNLRNLQKTAFALVSKSGSTLETLGLADFLKEYFDKKGLNFSSQCVAITENKKSSLADWAAQNSVPTLEIPLDVGGRYSVLSPVGLLPAAFLGASLEEIRQGALAALDSKKEILSLVSEIQNSWQREEWITSFWFYAGSCRFMGLWLEQLWAESLAKKVDRSGKPAPRVSTPWCLVGPQDQHSVLQQINEGAKDKFVVFMRFLDRENQGSKLSKSNFPSTEILKGKSLGTLLSTLAESTESGLNENKVSTSRIEFSTLDARGLGFYFMAMQLLVGVLGEALAINAFDQPGVELGKRLAQQILKKFN